MTIFGNYRPSRRAVLGGAATATIIAAADRFPRRARAQTPVKITLGYQSLWAAQGEIFETLRNTNILALYGFDAQFKTFTFGPPLVEAAVAGDVDNLIAADIPVLRGAARLAGTKVLARTHDWRWGIVAQPDFKGGVADLKGKRFSGAFGTTVFPRAVETIVAAGIADPFREIDIINQDVTEQVAALQSKQVDAVSTWDPTLERLVRLGFRLVHESKQGDSPAWLGLTGRWLERNGDDAAVALLKAWVTAVWWTSNNLEQARAWFSETSRIDKDILAVAGKADRYLKAPVPDITKLDFAIDAEQVSASQRVVAFLVERKLLQQTIDVPSFVDRTLITRAQAEIAAGKRIDLQAIKPRSV